MRVNNIEKYCDICENANICNARKKIEKFDEEYSNTPLVPDISIDGCENFSRKGLKDLAKDDADDE